MNQVDEGFQVGVGEAETAVGDLPPLPPGERVRETRAAAVDPDPAPVVAVEGTVGGEVIHGDEGHTKGPVPDGPSAPQAVEAGGTAAVGRESRMLGDVAAGSGEEEAAGGGEDVEVEAGVLVDQVELAPSERSSTWVSDPRFACPGGTGSTSGVGMHPVRSEPRPEHSPGSGPFDPRPGSRAGSRRTSAGGNRDSSHRRKPHSGADHNRSTEPGPERGGRSC